MVHGFPSRGRSGDSPGNGLPSWSDRLAALKYVPPLLKMVYQTHRGYTLAIVALRVVRALVPLGLLWVGKLIIEAVEFSYRDAQPVDWYRLGTLVALELGIAVAGEALARASALFESLLGDLFSNRVSVRLMEHAARLDVAQFEDDETYDHLERARRQTVGRIGLLAQILSTVQDLITLLSLAAALILYVPWLLLLLAVAVIPAFLGETHFAALGYSLLFRWTPERRMLDYLRFTAASDGSAKEVKLFRLAPFLVGRYAGLADDFYRANKRLSTKRATVSTLLAAVGSVGYYGAYAVIIYLTVIGYRSPAGLFTIGVLTFLAGSFRQSRDLIQRILLMLSQVYEQSLYLRDLFAFFELKPRVVSKPGAIAVPKPITRGFLFEDVSFKYPGSDQWAVRNLSFALRSNESVALVGENGAGKTTLVKLLSRLYDPEEGRILLDGVDLREYDLGSLWANVGVIFQDFVRYAFLFKENIGVGQVEYVDDEARIREAARRSLADSVAQRLAGGFDQQLGRRFDGGVELSGGEWQKIALGRAYMREAQVLILDEPTASLDARAEYEVFLRFTELTRGRIAVLISHRFSTVRMADRILVLQDGSLLEHGTHEELLTRRGLYAELFNLQAAGYR
ncbi:MAG: ATP-binding cassette domain-containing protein [Gemmatimonadales bacterium]|nr:ATP-binding cassette domain-containing protein [Gemmatimonadales bacterium]NIN11067.1 ATP-binding cassette domain-containing protein [Gemmatimonadales bacterium]NIN49664.1 ATP-binding cassette domain-containing protein [Gemmatimonadales bacterium]NIP07128.1 ATP-binding cassette domain-containing protein [Gemmatimonadales bacterium]NIQ99519.1 ATP-binding cassette domain-containing protein [Gemmatimonadales bacterium]